MKFFAVLLSLATVTLAANEDHCYKGISDDCKLGSQVLSSDKSCNSKYLSFEHEAVSHHFHDFAMNHLVDSYIYLLTAANFGSYEKNREGFQNYFQKLSDDTWEQAIDIIKYISKRGDRMVFRRRDISTYNKNPQYEHDELGSMANALSITKKLAKDANRIHALTDIHDAEVSSYIEEHFVHKQSSLIRELSGHTNDLKKFYLSSDKSLALFLFDDYLKH